MNRNIYDDWNSAVPEEKDVSGTVLFNSHKNSKMLIFSSYVLIVLGLICLYSSSCQYAVSKNLNQFNFVLKQLFFIGIGIVCSFLILVAGYKFLEIICPVLMLGCLVTCIVSLIFKLSLLSEEVAVHTVLIIQTMYLSLFFANRPEGIKKLRELVIPITFSVIILIPVLMQNSFTYGIFFIVLTIVLFACGGVGFGGVMLLVVFAILPIMVWVLSSTANVKIMLGILVPGYIKSDVSDIVLNAKTAISNGGLFGVGIGNGNFKFGLTSASFREYIFCNFAEELGFVGVFTVVAIFMLIIYCSFRSAKHLKNVNRFYSNFSCGLSLIFTGMFVLNLCSILDILPVNLVSMPFFSYSPDIIVTICECALLYKMSKTNVRQDSVFDEGKHSDNDFEVGYEAENI